MPLLAGSHGLLAPSHGAHEDPGVHSQGPQEVCGRRRTPPIRSLPSLSGLPAAGALTPAPYRPRPWHEYNPCGTLKHELSSRRPLQGGPHLGTGLGTAGQGCVPRRSEPPGHPQDLPHTPGESASPRDTHFSLRIPLQYSTRVTISMSGGNGPWPPCLQSACFQAPRGSRPSPDLRSLPADHGGTPCMWSVLESWTPCSISQWCFGGRGLSGHPRCLHGTDESMIGRPPALPPGL